MRNTDSISPSLLVCYPDLFAQMGNSSIAAEFSFTQLLTGVCGGAPAPDFVFTLLAKRLAKCNGPPRMGRLLRLLSENEKEEE
jgi:hypothetical protein